MVMSPISVAEGFGWMIVHLEWGNSIVDGGFVISFSFVDDRAKPESETRMRESTIFPVCQAETTISIDLISSRQVEYRLVVPNNLSLARR